MQIGTDFSIVTVATISVARPLHQQAVNAFALLQGQINRVRQAQVEEETFRKNQGSFIDNPTPRNAEMTADLRVTGIVDPATLDMTKRAIAWIAFARAAGVPFDLLQRSPPLFTIADVAELAVRLAELFEDNGAGPPVLVSRIPTLADVNTLFDRPGTQPPRPGGTSPPPGRRGPSFVTVTVAALVGIPVLAWLVKKARS
jgi:hypothetical protein